MNVFVKPDEQSRVYSNFAMARIFVQASAEGMFTWTMPSAAENVKEKHLLKTNSTEAQKRVCQNRHTLFWA